MPNSAQATISVSGLQGVSWTCLAPLFLRARESQNADTKLHDPKAVEICSRLDLNISEMEELHGFHKRVVARTCIIDNACRAFLEQHPDAVVVNLGAGMDTRYSRLDNGRALWFDLDLPEVIQIREQLFERSERIKFFASPVSDFTWIPHVPRNRPALFIAEALLSYLEEHEVRAVVRTIAEHFPGSGMIAEVMSSPDRTATAVGLLKKFPPAKWGVASLSDLETWRSGITLEEQWFTFYYFENEMSFDLITWLALRSQSIIGRLTL